jgi:hypothetical protein
VAKVRKNIGKSVPEKGSEGRYFRWFLGRIDEKKHLCVSA